MPFKQVFERRVNENMHTHTQGESEAGPAPPRSPASTTSFDDSHVKSQPLPSPRLRKSALYDEAKDLDMSSKPSKGDKDLPPRFSTLFDTGKPPPTPRVVECCHRGSESKKRGGVFLSTPVFILLVVVLLFESTLLFAYTVIGLYQNLPRGLLGVVGAPAPVDGCRCEGLERQGAINFAPNFVFGGGDGVTAGGQLSVTILEPTATATVETTASETTMVTKTSEAEATPSTASSTSKPTSTSDSTSTTSTTSSDTKSAAAVAASNVLSLFDHGLGKPSTTPSQSITVVTKSNGAVQSIVVVQSTSYSSTTDAPPMTTATSVEVVNGPTVTGSMVTIPPP